MQKAKISLIAAMDEKRGIGKDGKIPWHIPEDLNRFRQITSGHPVIMGRRTYESIGRLLPNRINAIVTKNVGFRIDGAIIAHSLEEAVQESIKYQVSGDMYKGINKEIHDAKYKIHKTEHEVFIIGGGQIYAQAINLADKLYLTIVKGDYEADTFFPDYSEFRKVLFRDERESDGYGYTFLVIAR